MGNLRVSAAKERKQEMALSSGPNSGVPVVIYLVAVETKCFSLYCIVLRISLHCYPAWCAPDGMVFLNEIAMLAKNPKTCSGEHHIEENYSAV